MSDKEIIKLMRQAVDSLELASHIDDDGDISIVFSATDGIPYEVTMFIMEEEGYIGIRAYIFDFEVPEEIETDVLVQLNRHNLECKFPKAYMQNQHVMMEFWVPAVQGMETEYIAQNIIAPFISGVAEGYRNLFEHILGK